MSTDVDPNASKAAQLTCGVLARMLARDENSDMDAGIIAEEIVQLLGSERRAYLAMLEMVTLILGRVQVRAEDLRDLAALLEP